jgi:hypothetical protein
MRSSVSYGGRLTLEGSLNSYVEYLVSAIRPMSLCILKQLNQHQYGPFPAFLRENETAKILHYHVLDFMGYFGVYCRHCRGHLRLTVTNNLSLVYLV